MKWRDGVWKDEEEREREKKNSHNINVEGGYCDRMINEDGVGGGVRVQRWEEDSEYGEGQRKLRIRKV